MSAGCSSSCALNTRFIQISSKRLRQIPVQILNWGEGMYLNINTEFQSLCLHPKSNFVINKTTPKNLNNSPSSISFPPFLRRLLLVRVRIRFKCSRRKRCQKVVQWGTLQLPIIIFRHPLAIPALELPTQWINCPICIQHCVVHICEPKNWSVNVATGKTESSSPGGLSSSLSL
jgi:hypothetical protein